MVDLNHPLRILHLITPTGFYGAERWILALLKANQDQQIRYQMAVTEEGENQDLEIVRRTENIGIPTHKVPMSGRFDLTAVFKLSKIIRAQQIDIIHTHGYKSDIMGLLTARKAGIRCLATPHGFENRADLKLKLFMFLGKQALKHVNAVSPLSKELEQDMRKIGVRSTKIHTISNGIDLAEIDELPPSNSEHTNGTEKRIVYVGQLTPRKNLPDMLRAFDVLYQKMPSARLLLIGEGPDKTALQDLADSLSAKKQIEFLGYRNDRLSVVRSCDLFCMTSSLEGIPRAMMEAMALGLPAVAYDIPGVDELILPEKTGLRSPFGDYRHLADNMYRMLLNSDLALSIGRAAKKHIYDHFSAQSMAEKYVELYRKMLYNRS